MPLSPVAQKLLDYLACLTRGNEDVAAVCFDGQKLLFANNYQKKSEIFQIIKDHLILVASTSYDLKEKSKNYAINLTEGKIESWQYGIKIAKEYKKQKDKCKRSIDNIMRYAERELDLFKAGDGNYIEVFTVSLKHVTRSIRHSFLYSNSPLKLDEEIIKAIIEDGDNNIDFIKVPFISPFIDKGYVVRMHAEMQLLEHMLSKEQKPNFYIGVSKKCCKTCEKIIDAVNEVNQTQITVRGKSAEYFPAHWPPFLENKPLISKTFLHLMGAEENSPLEVIFYDTAKVKTKHVHANRMNHSEFSSDHSTEESKRYPKSTTHKLENVMNRFNDDSIISSDDESDDESASMAKASSQKETKNWIKVFKEAKEAYLKGKIQLIYDDKKNALTYFKTAAEKYTTVKDDPTAEEKAKEKATEVLKNLESPDGKYSEHNLKF